MLGATVAAGFLKFFEQFLLAISQVDRRFNHDMAHQIAMRVAANPLDPLAAQTENTPGLGFSRNLDRCRTVQRRNLDFSTQSCGCEGDRHFTMQIIVIARKDGVLFEVNLDVKIARRATIDTMLTFASQPDPITLIDPGRNLDGQSFVLLDPSGTCASFAGVGNVAASTMTFRASLLDREETLL